MKPITRLCSMLALGLTSTLALAVPPKTLITHNKTNLDSNAFIAGRIPSQHPTRAHSDGKVIWASVNLACRGLLVNGTCPAVIKLNPKGPNPITLGMVNLDLKTGIIQPKELHANGYALIVNGPGETTIIQE
jgi:hypothetical protein